MQFHGLIFLSFFLFNHDVCRYFLVAVCVACFYSIVSILASFSAISKPVPSKTLLLVLAFFDAVSSLFYLFFVRVVKQDIFSLAFFFYLLNSWIICTPFKNHCNFNNDRIWQVGVLLLKREKLFHILIYNRLAAFFFSFPDLCVQSDLLCFVDSWWDGPTVDEWWMTGGVIDH